MTFAYYDMENPIADWPGLASELQTLYTTTHGGRMLPAAAARLAAAADRAASQARAPAVAAAGQRSVPSAGAARYTTNRAEAYYAIQCADSLLPTSTSVYHNLASTEDAKVPGFGRLIVYDMMPCATWPDLHTDAYDGPWNRSKTTILVVNAQHDPITPIWGAKAAVRELGNARLLTVAGDGHTSMYVEPSKCRDAAQAAYLITQKLPAVGTVCPVDQLPFGLPARSKL
jgi:pimeloyl-ACP methyl ester carboxylesterase